MRMIKCRITVTEAQPPVYNEVTAIVNVPFVWKRGRVKSFEPTKQGWEFLRQFPAWENLEIDTL